jgi:macrolide-specific efflux system membrane fusion protein
MKRPDRIIILCLGVFLLVGCKSKGGNKQGNSGYKPITVSRGNLQLTVLATGNVQPQNQLSIFPSISGRIDKILIKEGDNVKKGQRLMEMSSTERATLLDAAAAKGQKQLEHWSKLYQSTPLLSPEDGQIIFLPTVPGQGVNTGTTLMIMSDHLVINTQVDETDLAQIKLDQRATITLDAYSDQPFQGTVKRISYFSTMVNNVTTYQVFVWPDKVPEFMRSGMTANVVFNTNEKKGILLVPSEAVQQDGTHSYVLVPSTDPKAKGEPQTVTVQTGITDGKQVEVLSGLKEGDRVLMSGFSADQLEAPQTGSNPFMTGPKRTSPPKGGSRKK